VKGKKPLSGPYPASKFMSWPQPAGILKEAELAARVSVRESELGESDLDTGWTMAMR